MDLESGLSPRVLSALLQRFSKNSAPWLPQADQSTPPLDSLPEDVLLELFSYLNSSDLCNLCVCSTRIGQICKDHRLWRKIRDCCNGYKPQHNSLPSIFSDSTSRIKISRRRRLIVREREERLHHSCLGPNFFKSLRNTPNLESFIVENHSFNITTFSLNYFPESLTELRLNGSHIFRTARKWRTVFVNVHKKLPNLEILDLSRCHWMKSPALKQIFKCAKMKTLILYGCKKLEISGYIQDDRNAPLFSSLETFDLRRTQVELEDLWSWPRFQKLKHFFLDPIPVEKSLFQIHVPESCTVNVVNWLKNIETLVIQNESLTLTDSFLKELRNGCPSLEYLDVTGAFCSTEALIIFQNKRPDVTLLHESLESDFC